MTTENLELVQIIENDVFDQLKLRFHKSGKGRPPKLPQGLCVTNELLVQLHFLKGQEYSYADLKRWLEDVEPNTATVTVGRIRHQLDTILDHCATLTSPALQQFLQMTVDFNALSQPLSALGLTRLHFENVEEFSRPHVENLSNGVVFELDKFRSTSQETHSFVHRWLRTLCSRSAGFSDKQLKSRIQTVVSKCKTFSKKQDLEGLDVFLKSMFFEQIVTKTESDDSICRNCLALRATITDLSKELVNAKTEMKEQVDTIEQLKHDLEIKLEIINVDLPKLADEKNALQQMVKELKEHLKEVKKEKDKLCQENEDIKKSSLYQKNFDYKKRIVDVEEEKEGLLQLLRNENNENARQKCVLENLKKKLKTEQSLKSQYKSSLSREKQITNQLKQMLQFDKEGQEIKLREEGSSHRYSENIRKTFYALQGEANVPATNCSKIVSLVAQNLMNVDVGEDQLPSSTSSLNFSNEAHVIAKSQIAEEIEKVNHYVYACDGTSRQKASFLEKHLILSNGRKLSLGYSEVVTEDSATLLETCVSAMKELVEVKCIVGEKDEGEQDITFKDLIRKMKGLLSDRAAVMKAFDQKMADFKENLLEGEDTSTHFLFCNAHFLLALSSACDEAITSVEKVVVEATKKKLGRDQNPKFSRFAAEKECATLRLLRTASNVLGPRGDEKSGCRQNWLAYCHQKKKKSMFSSYRSNRFNNLFTNATALLCHREDIVDFLENFNPHSNSLLESILEDVKDSEVLTNVAVLAFFHVFFTEPYWQLMNSKKSYADFPAYVKKMKAALNTWCISTPEFDPSNVSVIFEDFPAIDLHTAVIKQFFKSSLCDLTSFKEKLAAISDKCSIALSRQLGDFLDGGLFGGEIEEEVLKVLKTCPLTNLTGEQQFGDLDYCMNTRRNCSLFNRSTRNMWKHNNTAKFLSKKKANARRILINKAVKYGPVFKRRSMENKKALTQLRVENGNLIRRKKNEKEIKFLMRKNAAMDAIMARGSLVVSTKEELDSIFFGKQPLQRLREQIRFRNLCSGAKIRITGTKQVLYERLLKHISSN